MVEHWKYNGPPVYMSVAGYLGLIKDQKARPGATDEQKYGNLDDLEALFAGTGGVIQ